MCTESLRTTGLTKLNTMILGGEIEGMDDLAENINADR